MAQVTRPKIKGDIEFRDLNFANNGEPVLHNINLKNTAQEAVWPLSVPRVRANPRWSILIPRIYDAHPGTVLIDGRPIREYPLAVLRRNIGFVPQETFLFSETMRENIAFGEEDASDR